jgi:tetratricopeptide (TPR) repeat protein
VSQRRGFDPGRRSLALALLWAGATFHVRADPGGDFDGLLAQGEAALRANDAAGGVRAYERAAALRHVAAAEWGLVRAWMQAGDYRRALAFAAHAAGAHPDVVAGAGLYAWLLNIGGQPAIARQTLDEALKRHPQHDLLAATAARLEQPARGPAASLLIGATRQAPHAALALPASVRAMASGVLHSDGLRAIVPSQPLVAAGESLWLRDAMGRTSPARLARLRREWGLAELVLEAPLGHPTIRLELAARDAFPGSPELAVEFAAAPDQRPEPEWPLLHTGFVGAWQAGPRYALGAALASSGAHGGPVFDRAGRWIGLAMRGAGDRPALLAASALQEAWPELPVADAAVPAPGLSPDQVYERAMACAVQLLVLPPSATAPA